MKDTGKQERLDKQLREVGRILSCPIPVEQVSRRAWGAALTEAYIEMLYVANAAQKNSGLSDAEPDDWSV